MKNNKPFWETDINPITGFRVEAWHINDIELEKINNYKKRNCIILSDKL
jgi:hypothetical protein